MKSFPERVLSIGLTVAALAVAVVLVHREFFAAQRVPAVRLDPPEFLPEWRDFPSRGTELGSPHGKIQIALFADLECPACRFFHESVLPDVTREFEGDVSIVFIHFPLRGHRFARLAALAAECAGEQGAFGPLVDQAFAKQDSIGLKSWSSYAHDAGVSDTLRFEICRRGDEARSRVDRGAALADSLHLRATPTIIVNGWRFGSSPPADELRRVIRDLLADRNPFPSAT